MCEYIEVMFHLRLALQNSGIHVGKIVRTVQIISVRYKVLGRPTPLVALGGQSKPAAQAVFSLDFPSMFLPSLPE